jgi:hypothetical protein
MDQAGYPLWRMLPLLLLLLAQVCRGQAAPIETPKLTAPTLARVSGDGVNVDLAWYAAKGATGYQVLRASDPSQPAASIHTLPATTLGYRDVPGGAGPTYYQVVAMGPNGGRAAGAWFMYEPPTITNVAASASDISVTWSGVKSAPGGYEIWRTVSLQQSGTRIGSVSSANFNYLDKQAGSGPFYYQVVAIGAGSWRAASAWYGFNVPQGVTGTASSTPTSPSPSGSGPVSAPSRKTPAGYAIQVQLDGNSIFVKSAEVDIIAPGTATTVSREAILTAGLTPELADASWLQAGSTHTVAITLLDDTLQPIMSWSLNSATVTKAIAHLDSAGTTPTLDVHFRYSSATRTP